MVSPEPLPVMLTSGFPSQMSLVVEPCGSPHDGWTRYIQNLIPVKVHPNPQYFIPCDLGCAIKAHLFAQANQAELGGARHILKSKLCGIFDLFSPQIESLVPCYQETVI